MKKTLYFCSMKKQHHEVRDYFVEEPELPMVGEPEVAYGCKAQSQLRMISDEELARCITLEESERLITEKIYRHYHPEE